jgi:sugar/nucleoside kinase (ribokinase family)
MATGLFVGLVTLDLIYLTAALPEPDQKLVALDYLITAGGPATNAAITFQHLSNSARLMGVIGCHPVSQFVLAELHQRQIDLYDLQPNYFESLPTSSILVTQSTGERAVISINATRAQASAKQIPAEVLQAVHIVLIDGHQMAAGQEIARQANAMHIPVVIDGGSWKPGFEVVLPYTDYAICSANFRPPDCETPADILHYLEGLGIPNIAITQGEQPIIFSSQGKRGELPVPVVKTVDTLGAGDIFHGAFCHFILQTSFEVALNKASQIAARACESFGPRQWMEEQSE